MSPLRKNRIFVPSVTRSLLSIRPRLIRAADRQVSLQYFLSERLIDDIGLPHSKQLRGFWALVSNRSCASVAFLAPSLHFREQNRLFR
jgi:hypothetical protein